MIAFLSRHASSQAAKCSFWLVPGSAVRRMGRSRRVRSGGGPRRIAWDNHSGGPYRSVPRFRSLVSRPRNRRYSRLPRRRSWGSDSCWFARIWLAVRVSPTRRCAGRPGRLQRDPRLGRDPRQDGPNATHPCGTAFRGRPGQRCNGRPRGAQHHRHRRSATRPCPTLSARPRRNHDGAALDAARPPQHAEHDPGG